MKFTDNALNVLAAKTYRGIGRAWIVKNLKVNESAARLVALLNRDANEERLITIHELEERKQIIRPQRYNKFHT